MKRPNNRLMALQLANKASPRAYRIENAGDEATIYLYDVIGYDWWTDGGITAMQFAADLNAIRADTIHLRFNSPGGDVFDGRAICAAMDAHPARLVGHVDGLAASAASFILMHCDEVEITEGALLMIHNGWTMAAGDKRVMGETASLLAKIDTSIQADYLRRPALVLDADGLTAAMDAETWITAAEAVEQGFADRIAAPNAGKAAAQASAWNLSAYANAPKALAVANSAVPDLNDAERAFVVSMIAHHQMALDMVDALYTNIEAPEIKALADGIIAAQAGEIALMQRWLGEATEPAEAKKKKPMKMEAAPDDTVNAIHAHRLRKLALVETHPA